MQLNKIHNINFLNNTLPDKCASLIIADPPYYEVKGDFDFIWANFDEYLADVERWVKECKRLLADNGTLFWWGMDRKIAYAQIILDKYLFLLGTLVWEKPAIPSEWETRRTFPERGQERILMYAQGGAAEVEEITGWEKIKDAPECFAAIKDYLRSEKQKSGLNTDWYIANSSTYCSHYFALSSQWAFPTEKDYKAFQKSGFFQKPYEALRQEYESLRQEYESLRQEYESLRRPFDNFMKLTDVLKFSQDSHSATIGHPTAKPQKLTRALILTCSRPNDLVLAPFAGSGTECVMAAKEGRQFIGFDIEQKYCDIANKRVADVLNSPQLF